MINILTILIFFLFSLGQLGRVSLNQGQINFYLYEVGLVCLFVFFFFKLRFLPIKNTFKKSRYVYYFVFFLILSFLISFLNYKIGENTVGLLYLARLTFYLAFPLYLYFYAKRHPDYLKTLKSGLILLFIMLIGFSVIQYFFYPDLRNLYYLGWDPHLNRLFSVFFDTSVAASIFGLIFFYLYKARKYLLAFPFLLFLVLTFSRSAYLFFGITFLVDIVKNKKFKLGLTILALAILAFALAPKQFGFGVGLDRVFSISSRMADYQKGIAMWQRSPIVGHGYNRLAYVKKNLNLQATPKENFPVHSAASLSGSFLIILVTSGVIGLVLFVTSLIQLGRENMAMVAPLFFLFLMSLTDNIIFHPFILFLFGVIYVVSLPSGKSQPKS